MTITHRYLSVYSQSNCCICYSYDLIPHIARPAIIDLLYDWMNNKVATTHSQPGTGAWALKLMVCASRVQPLLLSYTMTEVYLRLHRTKQSSIASLTGQPKHAKIPNNSLYHRLFPWQPVPCNMGEYCLEMDQSDCLYSNSHIIIINISWLLSWRDSTINVSWRLSSSGTTEWFGSLLHLSETLYWYQLLSHPRSYTIIGRQRNLLTYVYCEIMHKKHYVMYA